MDHGLSRKNKPALLSKTISALVSKISNFTRFFN
jgi:hypothetical protein